ncbi:hypothetical protein F7X37_00458 [Candidatus Ecksteinia adelgidicola]|nr:hypothetical protein F7X37_00458 [Candidatus Ecksteinia adelgidicola]
MSIIANNLYRDSLNFFRNQFTNILILSLLTAFVPLLFNQILRIDNKITNTLIDIQNHSLILSSMDMREFIQTIQPYQQLALIKTTITVMFLRLINYVFLIGGMITLLQTSSQKKHISVFCAVINSTSILPRLLVLLFVCNTFIQIGLRLFIVPGIIITLIFLLASIIMSLEKKNIFTSIKSSCTLIFVNIRLITPIMMFFLLIKMILYMLNQHLSFNLNAMNLILTTLNHLLSTLLLIYLFRLYMLLKGNTV